MNIVHELGINQVTLEELLTVAYESGASDLHIAGGNIPVMRLHGRLVPAGDQVLLPGDTERIAKKLLSEEMLANLNQLGEVDFSFSLPKLCRFRANVFKQKRMINLAFRILSSKIPPLESLNLPDVIREFTLKQQGLVVITGPTGSGKSTTLASMIDYINNNSNKHIITLEDPVEYIHTSVNCLIAQREVGKDTHSFANGLRAALRQDPDVIFVGEMRDLETIRTAITAAETGHLVFGTLHTPDAPQTVDRIIDVFPTEQQRQIRVQLASVLVGVASQRLIPKANGMGRAVALEILINTPAVANLIRQEKIYQIKTIIQTNRHLGMQTMSSSLKQLVSEGIIHREAIREYEMGIGED